MGEALSEVHLRLVGPGHCTLHKIKTQNSHNANRPQLFSMATIYLVSPAFYLPEILVGIAQELMF